mgnify:CR=1 FL=1
MTTATKRRGRPRKKALEIPFTLEEVRRERAKKDIFYFVENYCYIENKDVPEQRELFHLWDGQKEALRAFQEHRLNIVLKARQMGLTWLALVFALHGMMFFPGFTVVGLSKKEDDAKELVRRLEFLLRNLPDWMVRPHSPKERFHTTYEATSLSIQFYHDGQETSRFVAMAASRDAGRSFTANLVIIDEWAFQQWAREIWTAAYPTVNRPTGGKVIGISTGLRGTLFEEIWNAAVEGKNSFHPIFLPWWTDPRRTPAWYEQTKRDLPLSYRQEYPATPEDAFSGGEGAFFPEFDPLVHVVEPFEIPAHWQRYRTLDYGLDMLACYWIAIDPQGTAYVYREVHQPNLIISQAAHRIREATPMNEHIRATYAPPDLWNRRQDTGKSATDIFREHGIYFVKSSNDRHSGWMAMKEWLRPYETLDEQTGEVKRTAKLKIFSTCRNLIKYLPQLRRDENDPNDADTEPHEATHAPDAIRYFCVMQRSIAGKGDDARKPSRSARFDYDEDEDEQLPQSFW